MKRIVVLVALMLGACRGEHMPSSAVDSVWQQDDAYGRGQRGTAPNGGRGTVYQRDTPRAPVTPQ